MVSFFIAALNYRFVKWLNDINYLKIFLSQNPTFADLKKE